MIMAKEQIYGVCSVCGCTDTNPCWHPEAGNCWWTDDSHTICSHCADPVLRDDPRTIHCING